MIVIVRTEACMRTRAARALLTCGLALAVSSCGEDERAPTAPSLSASCEARPGSGQAPLPVSFLLSVSGAEGPLTILVNYGDGTTGSNPDTPHTYAAPGSYVASITVSTSKQAARCAANVTVGATAPTPAPGGNQPPAPVYKTVPAASGSTIAGRAPLAVRFNLCATSDAEGNLLWFSMDFDGDGVFDSVGTSGAACRQDHTYPAGRFTPRVCVHDMGDGREPLHPDQCRVYAVSVDP
jgi:PKD repeat protein